jgi:hypothetical protein
VWGFSDSGATMPPPLIMNTHHKQIVVHALGHPNHRRLHIALLAHALRGMRGSSRAPDGWEGQKGGGAALLPAAHAMHASRYPACPTLRARLSNAHPSTLTCTTIAEERSCWLPITNSMSTAHRSEGGACGAGCTSSLLNQA